MVAVPETLARPLVRLAVVRDLREEMWPSMDLVADMLLTHLQRYHADRFESVEICPPFRRRLTRVGALPRGLAFNADRLANRFWDYPRALRDMAADFDLFHLCDHSYAQLVHELPADRTGVFCHDLDTFRCLLEPDREPRSFAFKAMVRRTLDGLRKARLVFYTTETVREQIERYNVVDPSKLVQAPYGISSDFGDRSLEGAENVGRLAPDLDGSPFVLHVGSCIPRKRIDVLLDVFAGFREHHPDVRLVQIGGEWTPAQTEQIERLGVASAVRQIPRQPQSVIAEFIRRAEVVLMPSESEGFGLPVVEALACGAVVLASDIPVFREVGADAALYRPLADVPAWVDALDGLLSGAVRPADRATRVAYARRFSWAEHTRIIRDAYERIAG